MIFKFRKIVYSLQQLSKISKISYTTQGKVSVLVSQQQNSPLQTSVTTNTSGIGLSFPAHEVYPNGVVHKKEIPRSDLYTKFSLQGRDVRVLISSFNYPTILVRKNCILVDIKNIRFIVCPEKLILFEGTGNEQEVLEYIRADLQYQLAATHEKEETFFSYQGAPFELQILESILRKMCTEITNEYQELDNRAHAVLSTKDLGENEDKLYELLTIKNSINRFKNYVQEFHNSLQQLLENDEDMASCYLTEKLLHNKPRTIEDHEEVEMLLETYYTNLEDTLTRTSELLDEIQSTQEFQNISLNTLRNRMLLYELNITIAAFSVGIATLVVGIFGMNLKSQLENHEYAFYITSGGVILLAYALFKGIQRHAKWNGLSMNKKIYRRKFTFKIGE